MKNVFMILTNGFDPDIRVYKEAKYLIKKHYKVTVLCWDRRCRYKINENRDGINIVRFPIPSSPGSGLRQLIPYVRFLLKVKRYLKKNKCDFLHCHDFDGALIGYLSKLKKVKLIFDMHEIYFHYSYAKIPLFNYYFNQILKKFHYIIYVTESQKKYIANKFYYKLVFLPNYPEKKVYMPIVKAKGDKLRINYIGSLRDYDSLITLVKLSKKHNEYEVKLYGMGTAYEKLKDTISDYKKILYGYYDGIKESANIYNHTDILYCVYNPTVENWKNAFPVKLYESIITLTPIIVCKKTVAGEFVLQHQIGEVVDYGDLDALLNAVKKINDNYFKYVEKIKKISDKYTLEKVITNLNQIY